MDWYGRITFAVAHNFPYIWKIMPLLKRCVDNNKIYGACTTRKLFAGAGNIVYTNARFLFDSSINDPPIYLTAAWSVGSNSFVSKLSENIFQMLPYGDLLCTRILLRPNRYRLK